MTSTPKHLTHFEGGNALSGFRAQALLPRLQAVSPRITGVTARFVHWVCSDEPLARGDTDKLDALLRYGDPYAGATEGTLVVVAPRLGTVSPWASKASDIAHNCGLVVRRVERVRPSVKTSSAPMRDMGQKKTEFGPVSLCHKKTFFNLTLK